MVAVVSTGKMTGIIGCLDCQSNLELVRQLLSERTILDRDRQRFVPVTDINIVAAATTPCLPGLLLTCCQSLFSYITGINF